jgi:hypothetical protein
MEKYLEIARKALAATADGSLQPRQADELNEVNEISPTLVSATSNVSSKTDAPAWRQKTPSNSRSPIIPPAIRAIIEDIEANARAKGWPAELLYNAEFWGSPRGLAAVLDEGDAIAEVTTDYIEIFKVKHTIQRFQRRIS